MVGYIGYTILSAYLMTFWLVWCYLLLLGVRLSFDGDVVEPGGKKVIHSKLEDYWVKSPVACSFTTNYQARKGSNIVTQD